MPNFKDAEENKCPKCNFKNKVTWIYSKDDVFVAELICEKCDHKWEYEKDK